MKILLKGATSYTGKRLLLELIYPAQKIDCTIREKNIFSAPTSLSRNMKVIQAVFLDFKSLRKIPNDNKDIYYLMDSISNTNNYEKLETEYAINVSK